MVYKRLLMFVIIGLFTLTLLGCGRFNRTNVGNVPAVKGHVTDLAEVLSTEDKKYLQNLCVKLEKETSVELAIVTVKHMSGDGISDDKFRYPAIEEYALEMFRKNGFGKKEKNNGILLLISTGERKVRIEVGYGLEGALPDGKCGRILRTHAIPFLKNDQYGEGIRRTTEAIIGEIAGDSMEDVKTNTGAVEKVDGKGKKYGIDNNGNPAKWYWLPGVFLAIFLPEKVLFVVALVMTGICVLLEMAGVFVIHEDLGYILAGIYIAIVIGFVIKFAIRRMLGHGFFSSGSGSGGGGFGGGSSGGGGASGGF